MDGLESTRQIRSIGYTGPIVALSAFGEEGIGEQCSEAGVSHYLRYVTQMQRACRRT